MAAPYSTTASANNIPALYCEVDAEPLQRYRQGGYHPTHLSDEFNGGRYKILHKLGWGGYATIWLAKDFVSVTIANHMMHPLIPSPVARVMLLSKS